VTARLFVAVWPPAEVLDAVAGLERPEAPGVRWTPRPQWHVTLRFLGEADLDRLPPLDATAGTADVGPKVARLGRGVLCLPVTGLDELAAAVIEATRDVGRPPEDRPFRGHITLARLRDRARPPKGVVGTPFQATFPVTEVTLVASQLGGGPARYEVLDSAFLPSSGHRSVHGD
jgi:RNA 2',3'-cyclic 3'-phosphodiesterase